LRQGLYRMSGFDLTTIDGIGVDTAAVILSELGPDLSAFADEGRFVSYLRLAPNLSISAGKRVPGKFKAVTSTRVSNALRMAATTLRTSRQPLAPTIAVLPGARAPRSPFLPQPANWLNSSSA